MGAPAQPLITDHTWRRSINGDRNRAGPDACAWKGTCHQPPEAHACRGQHTAPAPPFAQGEAGAG